MGLMVVHHKVKDFAAWKQLFDEHAPVREAAGLTDGRVYQSVDDPNDVVILLDMADVGKAKAFADSEDLKAAMQRAGVSDAPSLHFLEGPIGWRNQEGALQPRLSARPANVRVQQEVFLLLFPVTGQRPRHRDCPALCCKWVSAAVQH